MDTASIIIKENGVIGLFSGLKMRICIQSMSSGISWGTYHIIKSLLESKSNLLWIDFFIALLFLIFFYQNIHYLGFFNFLSLDWFRTPSM